MLLISLVGMGFVMISVPSWLLTNYRAVRELGDFWARLYLAVVGTGAALLLGATSYVLWKISRASWRKRERRQRRNKNPSQLTPTQQRAELRHNLDLVDELKADHNVSDEVRSELSPLIQDIEAKRETQRLEIVAFGTISSGKSSLLNMLAGRDVFDTDARGGTTITRNEIPWPDADQVILVDTPGLGEVDGESRQEIAADAAEDADLVLLVLDGPLRQSEFALLELLAKMEKRVLLCLNKQDWYTTADRDALLEQLLQQVGDLVRQEDVLSVQAQPGVRTRVRVAADGEEVEEPVEVAPDIEPLARRMLKVVRRDGKDLLLANLLLQSRGLLDDARDRVRAALDRRAWKIVDKYMWGSAGTAALSPFPMVDLAAGCAISSKMVIDLAQVYKQSIDLNSATGLLSQQGKTLLGVLGSNVATPAVSSVLASLIKTVPGVGTVAGGLLQGSVQALITRWIGSTFIEYFRNEMREPPGGLAALAREQWQKVTSVGEIRKLVLAARERFRAEAQASDGGPDGV